MDTTNLIQLGILVMTGLGVLGATASWLHSRTTKVHDVLADQIAAVDAARRAGLSDLHDKIDAVKDTYVRRDDLAAHVNRMEHSQVETTRALDRLRERFDNAHAEVLRAVLHRNTDPAQSPPKI